jgi:hypothetical protein
MIINMYLALNANICDYTQKSNSLRIPTNYQLNEENEK